MLVLSRKVGEAIVIGHGVRLVVAEAWGNRVRLAVDAPPEVSVHREEVQRRLDEFAVSPSATGDGW